MPNPNNESRTWLYDKLKGKGYNVGKDYNEFDSLMTNNAESRKWVYDTATKNGLNVGKDYGEFESLINPAQTQTEQTAQAGQQTAQSQVAQAQEQSAPDTASNPYHVEVQDFKPRVQFGQQQTQPRQDFTPAVSSSDTFKTDATDAIAEGSERARSRTSYEMQRPDIDSMSEEEKQKETEKAAAGKMLDIIEDKQNPINEEVRQFFPDYHYITERSDRFDAFLADYRAKNYNLDEIDQKLADINQQIASINKQVSDERNAEIGALGARYAYGYGNGYIPDAPGTEELKAARRALERAKKLGEEAKRYDQGDTYFLGNVGRGMKDKFWDDDTWDWGRSAMLDAKKAMQLKDKIDRGEEITDTERVLLNAMAQEAQAQMATDGKQTRGYKAGETTMFMLPFMLEMAANPTVAGTKAAAKELAIKATDRIARYAWYKAASRLGQGLAHYLTKGGVHLATAIPGGVAQAATTGIQRVEADYIRRRLGEVVPTVNANGEVEFQGFDDSQVDSKAWAAYKALMQQGIENATEIMGAAMPVGKALSIAGRTATASVRKLGYRNTARILAGLGENIAPLYNYMKNWPVSHILERGNWNGNIEEFMEEQIGMALNQIMGVENTFTTDEGGMFNLDNQIDTLLGVGLFGTFVSTVATGSYAYNRHKARTKMAEAERLGSNLFGENWIDFKNHLAEASPEELIMRLGNIARKATKAEKDVLFRYADALTRYRAVGLAELAKPQREPGKPQPLEEKTDESFGQGAEASTPEEIHAVAQGQQSAEQMLAEADPNILSMLQQRLDAGASNTELQTVMEGLDSRTRTLAESYIASRAATEGVVAGAEQRAEQEGQRYSLAVGTNATEEEDGTSVITTGYYKDSPYYVRSTGGGMTILADAEGNTMEVPEEEVQNVTSNTLEELADRHTAEAMESERTKAEFYLKHNAKTQMDVQPGMVLQNGGTQFIVANVDGNEVSIVPAVYDAEQGRPVPQNNASANNISLEEAYALQDQYYDSIDNNNTLQAEADAQQPDLADTGAAGDTGMADTGTRTDGGVDGGQNQAEPAETPAYPTDKNGNTDYSQIDNPEMMASAAQAEFGGDAVAFIDAEIAEAQAVIDNPKTANVERFRARKRISMLNDAKATLAPEAAQTAAEEPRYSINDEAEQQTQPTPEQETAQSRYERMTEEGKKKWEAMQKDIDTLAKALGVKIDYEEGLRQREGCNGKITGTHITLDPAFPEKSLEFLLGHELTHRMQDLSPELYHEFKISVINVCPDFRERVDRITDLYLMRGFQVGNTRPDNWNGRTISREQMDDEAIADYVGEMYQIENALDEFISAMRQPAIIRKLIEFFNWVTNNLSGLNTLPFEYAQTQLNRAFFNAAAVNAKEQTNAKTEEQAKKEENKNDVQKALEDAEQETDTEPTEAQKEAGNYKKGHFRIDGYDVTIENPKGSIRRGTDASAKPSKAKDNKRRKKRKAKRYSIATGETMDVELTDEEEEIADETEQNVLGGVQDDGHLEPVRYSLQGTMTGAGFKPTIVDDDGNQIAMTDENGNLYVEMDGKRYDHEHHITVDDVKNHKDSALNYMMAHAIELGSLTPEKAEVLYGKYVDMLNAYLDKGVTTTDENGNVISGFQNVSNDWQFIGETVFRTVASNGDAQYAKSIDITRVCKKNEAVINGISSLQRRLGYGITPAQIMDLYLESINQGYQVPCPVCYVFSRYIRNGKFASAAINGMMKYGKHLPGQPDAWTVEQWEKELSRLEAINEDKEIKNALKKANDDVTKILDEIDKIGEAIMRGKLKGKEKKDALKRIKMLDKRYRAALDLISQQSLTNWINTFAIHQQGGKNVLYTDTPMPKDMDDFKNNALDLRLTANTMQKYPAIQRLRKSGGSTVGKEITFAGNNDLGSIIAGMGSGNPEEAENKYLALANETEPKEKAKLRKAAIDQMRAAILFAKRQSLRGGMRMWSWSDNIERLAPDVAINLMQLDMLGCTLQTYSKQLEGINLVARMNGYVNGSLMAYGIGYEELTDADVKEVDGKKVLAHDIIKTNEQTGKEMKAAEEGQFVYEENGKMYTLLFDDVVGIQAFDKADTKDGGKVKKGLFALNKTLDKAGNILVGMNDIHVKAAMADDRILFIIPWHSSGQSTHILRQMLSYLGVNLENFNPTDYTDMQEEKDYSKEDKIPDKLTKFWERHNYQDKFKYGFEVESGNGQLSHSQIKYRKLRDAILYGIEGTNGEKYTLDTVPQGYEGGIYDNWREEVPNDEFLGQLLNAVKDKVSGSWLDQKSAGKDTGLMTSGDRKYIYPYEYWDTKSPQEKADVNGQRYLEYCRRLGFKPKFTGNWKTDKAEEAEKGNFADSPGYWKLLIDRRMYDTEGKYQGLDAVDSTAFKPSLVDPKETGKEFIVTNVADDAGVERIVDNVEKTETERTGTMPTVKYNTDIRKAAAKYNEAYQTFVEEEKRIENERKEKEEKKKATTKYSLSSDLTPNQRRAIQMVNPMAEVESENRYSISEKADRDYLDAVESGDMEKAQQMVREAAKAAMPDTKVVDEDGYPLAIYHGTPYGGFSIFKSQRKNGEFYFSDNRYVANSYENNVSGENPTLYEVYLNITKPLRYDAKNKSFNELSTDNRISELISKAKEKGYDGVVIQNIFDSPSGWSKDIDNLGTVYIALSPSQIKSADPVTYDDSGNVIPLSERFNESNEDIRYSLSSELDERYPGWNEGSTKKNGGDNTQVTNTKSTYVGIGKWMLDTGQKDKSVLDASSGLGLGTQALREMGINVDDVEPYATNERMESNPPTYSSYAEIGKEYDIVISNVVLNVIPDDWREGVVKDMAEHTKPGGKMIVAVRPESDAKTTKNKIELEDENELLVLWPDGSYRHYQKFWTQKELEDDMKQMLGDGWKVERATPRNSGLSGKRAVVCTREGGSGHGLTPNQRRALAMVTGEDDGTRYSLSSASDFFATNYDEVGERFKNRNGTVIKRGGILKGELHPVGKIVDSKLYVHKDYANEHIKELEEKGKKYLPEGFDYKCLYFDPKTPDVIRYDEAPGFDKEREPFVGRYIKVDTKAGKIVDEGSSKAIWHGKWQWVGNDYKGFDVRESYEWQRKWASTIDEIAKGGSLAAWNAQLDKFGLPRDEAVNGAPDTRYSIAEDGTLVGVHNISEAKLNKAINMGGLVNPSLAVVDTDNGQHTEYGEISLIAPSELVDRKTGRNIGTFDRDAYTPIYPPVVYFPNKQSDANEEKLFEGLDKELAIRLHSGIHDYLERNVTHSGLEYLFLKERHPELKLDDVQVARRTFTTMKEISDRFFDGKEPTYKAYEQFPEDKKTEFNLFIAGGGRITDSLRGILTSNNPLDKSLAKRMREEASYGQFDGFIGMVEADERNVGKIDVKATIDAAIAKLRYDSALQSEFKDWQMMTIDNLGFDEKIQVGWKADGSRIYKKNTLENVSAYMKKQGRNASSQHWASGAGYLMAKVANNMKSLDSIRKNKGRLSKDADRIGGEVRKRIHDVLRLFMESGNRDLFSNEMNAFGYLEDIVVGGMSPEKVAEDFNKHTGMNLSLTDEQKKELIKLRDDIKDIPVRYFETKFERPVMLDEFAAAVVPSTITPRVEQGLKDAGLQIYKYDPETSGSREEVMQRAIDQEPNTRFSLAAATAPTFYSNAGHAVEQISQNKATPEQWEAMLRKNGGLKAEEDKWLGLTDWLHEQTGTVTKQQILDYINTNDIEVRDVEYIDNDERGIYDDEYVERFSDLLTKEYKELNKVETEDSAWNLLVSKYPGIEEFFRPYGKRVGRKPGQNGDRLMNFMSHLDIPGITRHDANSIRLSYTTKGLRHNREIALVVPSIEPYTTGDLPEVHFADEYTGGRAVAWIRFGETRDEAGNKVLVIDEVQSQRHQDARERGYKSEDNTRAAYDKALKEMNEYRRKMQDKYGLYFLTDDMTEDEQKEYRRLFNVLDNASNEKGNGLFYDVPDAPFRNNWQELAMKRMLRYAAENGYDKLAWTYGRQQAKRYGLSKVISSITAIEDDGRYNVIALDKAGSIALNDSYTEEELNGKVGKDIASRLIDGVKAAKPSSPNIRKSFSLTGVDLEVGGKGMEGFYDRMLPQFIDKYCKRLGTKTQDITLPWVEASGRIMHSIDITPEMKDYVLTQGQPRYSIASGDLPQQTIEAWDRLAKSQRFQLRETMFDYLTAVDKFQEFIAKENNGRVMDYQNAYMAMLALSSRNKAQMDVVDNMLVAPLNQIIKKITGAKARMFGKWDWNSGELRRLDMYLKAKHGLERNRDMAVREALREKLERDIAVATSKYTDAKELKAEIEKINKAYRDRLNDWYDYLEQERSNGKEWLIMQHEMDEYAVQEFGADLSEDYAGLSGKDKETPGLFPDADDWMEAAYDYVFGYEAGHQQADIDELWHRIGAIAQFSLNKQNQSGLTSAEYVTEQTRRYQFYVPLRGWNADIAQDEYDYIDSRVGDFGNPIKKAKGRKSEAGNVMGALLNIAYRSISTGNKNLAMQKFFNLVSQFNTNGLAVINSRWMELVDGQWTEVEPTIPADATPEETAEILARFERDMEDKRKNGEAKRIRGKEKMAYKTIGRQKNEHQVRVYIGGEEKVITVTGDPRITQALNGLTNPSVADSDDYIEQKNSAIRNFMAGAFTSKNMAFSIRNLARDTIHANNYAFCMENFEYWMRFTRNQNFMVGSVANMVKMMRLISGYNKAKTPETEDERLFKEFMDGGGATGYTYIQQQDELAEELADMLQKHDKSWANPVDYVKRFFELTEFFGNAAELSNRFAAFKTSRQMGRSVSRAVSDAKEITLNFNRKGAGAQTKGNTPLVRKVASMTNFGRRFILFFNANMQGKYQLLRMLEKHPVKTVASRLVAPAVFMGMALPVINNVILPAVYQLLGMGSGDDGDEDNYFDSLTDHERSSYLCFRLPNKAGWLKIPLPPDITPMTEMGDLIGAAANGSRDLSGMDVTKCTVDMMSPVNINWGSGDNVNWTAFGLSFAPTAVQPIGQAMTNTNYLGRNIYRKSFTSYDTDPEYRKTFRSTSPLLKELSRVANNLGGGTDYTTSDNIMDVNPALVQHFITSYLGGYGTTAVDITNALYSAYTGEDTSMTIQKVPVVSSFIVFGNKDVTKSRIESAYAEVNAIANKMKDKESNMKAGYKEAEDMGDVERAAKTMTEFNRMREGYDYKFYSLNKEVFKFVKKLDKSPETSVLQENLKYQLMKELTQMYHYRKPGRINAVQSERGFTVTIDTEDNKGNTIRTPVAEVE